MKRLFEVLIAIFISASCFGAMAVSVQNSATGNTLTVNSDGSINVTFTGSYTYGQTVTFSNGFTASTGTFTGLLTPTTGIAGITDGSLAATGTVGEHLMKTIGIANAVPFTTTGNWVTISTLTVTAGCWELFAIVQSSDAGTNYTANSDVEVRIATTNAITSQLTNNNTLAFDWIQTSPRTTGTVTLGDKTYPYVLTYVSVAASTSYYLMGKASYTGGSPKWLGSMRALRVR